MTDLIPQIKHKTIFIQDRPLTPIRLFRTCSELRKVYDPDAPTRHTNHPIQGTQYTDLKEQHRNK